MTKGQMSRLASISISSLCLFSLLKWAKSVFNFSSSSTICQRLDGLRGWLLCHPPWWLEPRVKGVRLKSWSGKGVIYCKAVLCEAVSGLQRRLEGWVGWKPILHGFDSVTKSGKLEISRCLIPRAYTIFSLSEETYKHLFHFMLSALIKMCMMLDNNICLLSSVSAQHDCCHIWLQI